MSQGADRASVRGGLRSCELVDGELVLVLNNTLAAIEDGRVEMLRFLEPRGLSPRVVNRLEVVFEELVSNIVRHGFTPGAEQTIFVWVAVRSEAVNLTLEDDGTPFNPLDVPEPQPFTSLERAQLGGLGIPLVRKLSASVGYDRPTPDQARRRPVGRLFNPRNRITVSIATAA